MISFLSKIRLSACLALLPALFAPCLVAAQAEAARIPGRVLVQLRPDSGVERLWGAALLPAGIRLERSIAPDWHMYLLTFDEAELDPQTVLAALQKHPSVHAAQWDYYVGERNKTPNDPHWFRKTDHTLMGLPEVWAVSTGGLRARTSGGADTIVIAVLESGGALLSHEDIAPNIWRNYQETPGNGIDDDGNGYVDDYRGWNPRRQNDSPGNQASHGTSVNGIAGARGDNGIGAAGVNWEVRLMNLAETGTQSEIVAGYQYVARMRRLYNQTQGQKGAFVVVTNASLGIDSALPQNFPLWCSVYDSLGAVGILSVAATTNSNVNVDQVGDIPTTCPSEFLISVTNVSALGVKAAAGYGKTHIDLGAPGEKIFTTANPVSGQNPPNHTSGFSGTSAASPQVAGVIALMYAAACPEFSQDAFDNPPAMARRMRDALFAGVQPESSLANITAHGGYVHAANTLKAINELCGISTGPLELVSVWPGSAAGRLFVQYEIPAYEREYSLQIFDILGRLMYEKQFTPLPYDFKAIEVNAFHWSTGVYVAVLTSGKASVSKKFFKN